MSGDRPRGLQWRSSEKFIICVVDFSVFSDVVLYGALVPVFPFALGERSGISDDRIQTCVSQLLAAYALGALVTNPIVGYFSDRASSRKIHYLGGLLVLLLSTFLVAVAREYWVLFLARVLQGSSSAVVWTVGMAVLADTMPTEQLGMAMGTVGSVVSLGMVSAPVIGGAVYHQLGYEAVFWVLGGMLFIDVILRLMMIERKDAKKWGAGSGSETEDESTGLLGTSSSEFDAKSILTMILTPRFLTASWMALITSIILSGPFDAVLPLHLKRVFDFTALTSGVMFAALAVPETALGPAAGWIVDRYGAKLAAIIGFASLCPALFLLVIPTGPASTMQVIILTAILLFNGCATSMLGAPAMTEITLQFRNGGFALQGNGYAQGYGWFNVAYSIGTLFGPLIAGWIVERWSWKVLCFVMGTLAGVTVIPALLFTGGKTEENVDDME